MAQANGKSKLPLRNRGRISSEIRGSAKRPRLSVFRSNNHIYAQLINDDKGHTVVSSSSLEQPVEEEGAELEKTEVSKLVGERLAEKALDQGIENAVFDRGNYRYHGRVKALAEGAREGGLHV